MPELKTRLKELRASRDMKQGDLAELVGVRRETIIRLEKGQYNPYIKTNNQQVNNTGNNKLFEIAVIALFILLVIAIIILIIFIIKM